jgi:hypothetical protein
MKPQHLFAVAALISFTLLSLIGCSSATIQEYRNESPRLVMEEYFNGDLEAHGVFQDRSGLVVKRFKVLMKCSWKGGVGTLEEDFIYSDGTKSRRVWTLTKLEGGKFKGTASDVIGEAQGEVAGNAFQWKYTLDLPVGEKSYHVQFDDWMYLMDDRVMLNKSKMSKFGIHLGEVTLAFIKHKP